MRRRALLVLVVGSLLVLFGSLPASASPGIVTKSLCGLDGCHNHVGYATFADWHDSHRTGALSIACETCHPNNHTAGGPPSAPDATYTLSESCLPCHVGKVLAPAHGTAALPGCASCHYPAGTVTGHVYGTGGALEGVSVTVGSRAAVLTYAGGQYLAANVPVGTYDVRFEAPGHVTRTVTDVVVADGGIAVRDVTLLPLAVPDTHAPLTTSDAVSTYVGTAVVRLSAIDSGGAGVAHTYFRLDGASPAEGPEVSTSMPGAHSLEFWSVDGSGNEEVHHTTTFSVMAPGPTPTWITIVAAATGARRGATVILSGQVSDVRLVGRIIVVYVQRPGKAYWSYSSNRVVYSRYGVPSWQYKYLFKSTLPLGTYRYKAVVPAYPGFATSATASSVSVRLR